MGLIDNRYVGGVEKGRNSLSPYFGHKL